MIASRRSGSTRSTFETLVAPACSPRAIHPRSPQRRALNLSRVVKEHPQIHPAAGLRLSLRGPPDPQHPADGGSRRPGIAALPVRGRDPRLGVRGGAGNARGDRAGRDVRCHRCRHVLGCRLRREHLDRDLPDAPSGLHRLDGWITARSLRPSLRDGSSAGEPRCAHAGTSSKEPYRGSIGQHGPGA